MEIASIEDQLKTIGRKLSARMTDLGLTPRMIQQSSGLALNSVKTPILGGGSYTISTLAKVCNSMGWTIFDVLGTETVVDDTPKQEKAPAEETVPDSQPEVSSIV